MTARTTFGGCLALLLAVGCGGGGGGGGAGSTGSAGATAGSTGSAGATAGSTGTAGSSGSTGTAGATSTAGSTGTAGATAGSTGTAGAAGATAGSTGTAGAAGSTAGATGTAGAGGAATLVTPVMRNGVYTLEFGNTKLTVDPAPGGRVVEYSLDGTNILTNATANASYWGSTFWTAPEGQWMGSASAKGGANGMLVPQFDTMPYPMTVAADNSFSGAGPNMTFANMTFNVTKKFSADVAKGAIDIVYSITNQGTAPMTTGHWEVTRVYPDGLTFFPDPPAGSKAPLIANAVVVNPCVSSMGGYTWLDHRKYVPGTPAKYGKYSRDASGGWIAHVAPAADGKGDLLLVKTFKDIADGTAGTGHGEVEIYYREDRSYAEVEDHHEQTTFAAGQKIDWPVRWYLRRLPLGVTRTAGNQMLIDAVKALVQ
jgi:hypothetical protein